MLQTARLSLGQLGPADAEFMLGMLNQPSFLRFIGDRGVRDRDGAERYVREGPMLSYAQRGFGMYRVARREDGLPVGLCGLVKRPGLDDVDLGYAFLPEHWGRGYAQEAAVAVIAHARRDLALPRLAAITDPDNASSTKLLLGLGFRHIGSHQLPGETKPVQLYRLEL